MTRQQIEQKIQELRGMKLPQLNKKSRAHHDWKLELDRLTNLLNKTK
jgi:hypothetical protein